jgi:hypothetical protein
MKLLLSLLLFACIYSSMGQTNGQMTVSPAEYQVSLVFNQQEFGDRLAVLTYSDDSYDYYVIDLTKIGGSFERVFFMNLTYDDSRLVNLDADIEKDQTWFKTYYNHNEAEVTCLFSELKDKTDKARIEMTDGEKEAWMAKYNKFKKTSRDE